MISLARFFLVGSLTIVIPAAVVTANPTFDVAIEELAAELVRLDPATATTTQYFSGAEQDALDRKLNAHDRMGPLDPAEREHWLAVVREGLKKLESFPASDLTPVQRTSKATAEWRLRDIERTSKMARQGYVFEQFGGLQITLVNFLTQTHPIRNARDIENYLVRLEQVPAVLDQGIAEAKQRAEKGIIPPKFILQAALAGLDNFLAAAPAKNVFVVTLDERASRLENLPAATRAAALKSAENRVRTDVIPAFQRIRGLLAEQMAVATDDAGVWKLPNGAEMYASALASLTTTRLTANEIHELGLKEVDRIEAQMDQILRELGYTEGTVNERYRKLSATLIPPADPDPRPALLAQYTTIVRDAERRAETLFDLRPKAPIEIRREPPFTEKSAAAHYSVPAPDGSKPGIFWAPLANVSPEVLWLGAGMKSVAYHEAVPGHHFQLTLQQELPEIPRFRQKRVLGFFGAYIEGWALYAERLAAEAGWYEGDPQGRLGQLNAELFRARRLVVDTGLHVKHWTRQQAIDYGIQASEVDRYVVWPGQACTYKIGELNILAQRAKAQQALGPKFSIKEFHNVILRTGAVPLEVLGQVVDEWIAGQTKST